MDPDRLTSPPDRIAASPRVAAAGSRAAEGRRAASRSALEATAKTRTMPGLRTGGTGHPAHPLSPHNRGVSNEAPSGPTQGDGDRLVPTVRGRLLADGVGRDLLD